VTSRTATVAAYLMLLGSLLLLELLARRGSAGVPRFGALVVHALGTRSTQVGLVLAWWWVGWHLVLGL